MGFVIKLTHKKGGRPRYMCAVPMTPDAYKNIPEEILDEGEFQHPPDDYMNTIVETLNEARRHSYPTAEVAAYVITTFPQTKNILYEVIAVDSDAKSAKAGR
jgi:hypothetical protein